MFNPFVKLADEPQVTITIIVDGKEQQALGFLYRCEGTTQYGMPCRLVWDRAHLAKACGDQRHQSEYTQAYGNGTGWVRKAVRRDGTVSAAVTPVVKEVPVLAFEDLKAQALKLGYRLSKIPVAKTPEFEVDEDLPF